MKARVVIDPEIQHGKPVLRGTRVPVIRILGSLASGMAAEDVCHEYGISKDELRAVFTYAVEVIDGKPGRPAASP